MGGGVHFPYKLPLPYSPLKCREYEQLAMAVLDQIFHRYSQYVRNELKFDVRQWRLVKSKEQINIYAMRERFPPSALYQPLDAHVASEEILKTADWTPMVKLCMTGTAMGSLEDCMYGAGSPTETAMLMKSLSIQDDFYHHRALCNIRIPTLDEPFTYCGLKWSARGTYIGNLIKARDMVYVEASGIRELFHDGRFQKVGYTLYHSVDLPEVAPLAEQDILRSRYSAVVLYREVEPGVVEIFNTTSLDPAGELPFKVTAFQAAEALVSVCKVPEYAMKKKLVWMQAARAHAEPNAMSELLPPLRSSRESLSDMVRASFGDRSRTVSCTHCSRALSALRSLHTCGVCASQVCRRCMTSRKLVLGYKKEELRYQDVVICKRCITTAQHMEKGTTLAIYEFVQPFDRIRSEDDPSTPMLTSRSQQTMSSLVSTEYSLDEPWRSSTLGSSNESLSHHVKVHAIPTESETNRKFDDEVTAERERLWKQINELCVKVEQTYQMAVEQTTRVTRAPSSSLGQPAQAVGARALVAVFGAAEVTDLDFQYAVLGVHVLPTYRRRGRRVLELLVGEVLLERFHEQLDRGVCEYVEVQDAVVQLDIQLLRAGLVLRLVHKKNVPVYRQLKTKRQTDCMLYLGYEHDQLVFFCRSDCSHREAIAIYDTLSGHIRAVDARCWWRQARRVAAAGWKVNLKSHEREHAYCCLLPSWTKHDLFQLGDAILASNPPTWRSDTTFPVERARLAAATLDWIRPAMFDATRDKCDPSRLLSSSSPNSSQDQTNRLRHTFIKEAEYVEVISEIDKHLSSENWMHVVDSEYAIELINVRYKAGALYPILEWARRSGYEGLAGNVFELVIHRLAADSMLTLYVRKYGNYTSESRPRPFPYKPIEIQEDRALRYGTSTDVEDQLTKWRNNPKQTHWFPQSRHSSNIDSVVKLDKYPSATSTTMTATAAPRCCVAYLQITVANEHLIDAKQLKKMNKIFKSIALARPPQATTHRADVSRTGVKHQDQDELQDEAMRGAKDEQKGEGIGARLNPEQIWRATHSALCTSSCVPTVRLVIP